ncbi:MAG: leucine-rich repeat domain-containing protein [Oligoflexales bacterium]
MTQQFIFTYFFLFIAHTTTYAQQAPLKFKKIYDTWTQKHPEGEKVLLKALHLDKRASTDKVYTGLQTLDALVIRRKKIYSLEVLNFAPKITHLTIIGNPLKSLSFVENLPELQTLHLGSILQGNQIRDIAPLRHAKKLTDLNLNHNFIEDLSPLEGLPLENLSLRGNSIIDFSPLLKCQQLEYLYAQGNLASEWPQGVFPKLKVLELNHNKIKAFEKSCEFPALTDLSIRHNQIHDFQAWPTAPNLKIVLIRNNPLTQGACDFLLSGQVSWKHDWQGHHHEEVAALLR